MTDDDDSDADKMNSRRILNNSQRCNTDVCSGILDQSRPLVHLSRRRQYETPYERRRHNRNTGRTNRRIPEEARAEVCIKRLGLRSVLAVPMVVPVT